MIVISIPCNENTHVVRPVGYYIIWVRTRADTGFVLDSDDDSESDKTVTRL
jgi:hypothetical protein